MEGKLRPSGLAAVAAAKQRGQWTTAYVSPGHAEIPEDFLKALNRDTREKRFQE
jgi:uncharacterized protein YdeI (YjbR/CyaY-like superfamily)